MGIFAGSDVRQNRVISRRGLPGLQGLRGLKGDTCTQDPKGVKGNKGVFGSDGKTAMAAHLNVPNSNYPFNHTN